LPDLGREKKKQREKKEEEDNQIGITCFDGKQWDVK